ncbi:MAG: hypothetical protein A2541_02105 [Candidatus Taylorbacteria bacterium RIFOXYD2_FULL_36_9]|uniref:Uncharacterized protein n=1 Tax=Candidatus Taylorbacteria bacterium RIFOXYD2_FULL_36_9 TaxID=1802338 RepID=A0A1G2PHU9_9BACT|nr:MAG: hypothetical protein A2541_02105 [Candidatus Taylorbacteria bacterium RIFOXYD2_FULL_36_9]
MRRLVRREPLEMEDWIDLIEARRATFVPFLGKISLRVLGDMKFFLGQTLNRECPRNMSSFEYPLNTQGFFCLCDMWKGDDGESGEDSLWGLTREGKWWYVVGRCRIINRVPRVKELYVEDVNTQLLLTKTQKHPSEIWRVLGSFIRSAVKQRRVLFEEVEPLEDLVIAEESAASCISLKQQ